MGDFLIFLFCLRKLLSDSLNILTLILRNNFVLSISCLGESYVICIRNNFTMVSIIIKRKFSNRLGIDSLVSILKPSFFNILKTSLIIYLHVYQLMPFTDHQSSYLSIISNILDSLWLSLFP